MKFVWYIQDLTDFTVDEVYTTKKAAFEAVKFVYGKGRFHKFNLCWYCYKPCTKDADSFCNVRKVPIVKRSKAVVKDLIPF